jgi:hypothetical protein
MTISSNQECRECRAPRRNGGGQGQGGYDSGWKPGDWKCADWYAEGLGLNSWSRNYLLVELRSNEMVRHLDSGISLITTKCLLRSHHRSNYHNFARYDSCRQCARSKPANAEAGGDMANPKSSQDNFLPGDWRCQCGMFRGSHGVG